MRYTTREERTSRERQHEGSPPVPSRAPADALSADALFADEPFADEPGGMSSRLSSVFPRPAASDPG